MTGNAIGVVGLGTMGCNLLLNISDHGLAVSGYDIDPQKAESLRAIRTEKVFATSSLPDFVASLTKPAMIILLVPAGPIVDSVLKDLNPILVAGDIVVDGGNSYYKDTERRFKEMKLKGLHFMGVGISGGEEGARHGPSIMPGGDPQAYQAIAPILNAIAADYRTIPCAAYMGNGPAGHYVKMVHNGIEYAIMQLLAESCHLLSKVNQLDHTSIADLVDQWNIAEHSSYLLESVSLIFRRKDDLSGQGWLLDQVLDVARSKGTGKWTSQDAMDLQVPVPIIDQAVIARDLSSWLDVRKTLAGLTQPVEDRVHIDTGTLRQGLYAAIMLSYIQGLHLIHRASEQYGYGTSMTDVVRNWRSGCIIRSAMLPLFEEAYGRSAAIAHLLLDKEIFTLVRDRISALENVVLTAIRCGHAIPCLQAALSYFRMITSAELPMNIIQGLRDHFGAHTFERRDKPGWFHADWSENGITSALPDKK